MTTSKVFSNQKLIYFSAIFLGIILSTGSILPMISNVQAQPAEKLIERFDQKDVPPGLTRVTIIHGINEHRVEIDHGPGTVPPPFQKEESFQCTNGAGTDQCDTNTWTGRQWPNLPVQYSVNLANSGDDGSFLAAVNAGIQTWEDDPNSSFDATFSGLTNQITSTAEPSAYMDGSNVIGWGSTSHFGGNIIAVVSYYYWPDTGNIVESDMRLNQDLNWSSNGGPGAIPNPDDSFGDTCCFDVQALATHEGGHFTAGLKDVYHSSENKLTMYGYGAKGQLHQRTLAYGDQLSIASAYPASSPPPPTNNPPTVTVDSPVNDSTFNEGDSISFSGTANDPEDGDVTGSLEWSSSEDGVIGSGGSFSSTLSVGTHTITATASDSLGETGSSSITVIVQSSSPPPPTGSIVLSDSISYTTHGGKNKDRHLYMTVHVVDDLGNNVNGASVLILLFNDRNEDGIPDRSWTGSSITESNGNVSFTLKNSPAGCYTTSITLISASGLTWDGNTPPNSLCK